ncbi:MAG: TVP38/TMEM64 family protein [Nitrospirota bacterium]
MRTAGDKRKASYGWLYKSKREIILLVLVLMIIGVLRAAGLSEYLTFENIKQNSAFLKAYVEEHYLLAVGIYIGLFISTAFLVPGALVLTLAGGFLFGVVLGTVYTGIGATAGASLSFLAARYIAGKKIQSHYKSQLIKFNKEIERNGYIYLIILRVVPVIPFFLVNMLAGLTGITYRTFLWTTFFGMLPGAAVYSFVGKQLGTIQSVNDLLSARIIAALLLVVLFTLLPILYKRVRKGR